VGAWPWLCLLAGAVVALAGGAAVWRGRRWPAMASRYQRPAPDAPKAPDAPDTPDAPAPAVSTSEASAAQLWDALDSGADPTEGR
ncbi:MAG: Trp biosynthesis-associated membrane protein, partial [Micromonosporaceae bacterium]